MRKEEDYIDQLFKDHFEDFAQSPAPEVWEGIVEKGTMANGKRFAVPAGWRSIFVLSLAVVLSVVLLSGSDVPETLNEQTQNPIAETSSSGEFNAEPVTNESVVSSQRQEPTKDEKTDTNAPVQEGYAISETLEKESGFDYQEGPYTAGNMSAPTDFVPNTGSEFNNAEILKISHQGDYPYYLPDSLNNLLSLEVKRSLRRGLEGSTYYKKERGGHWFVSGGIVGNGTLDRGSRSFSDGLVFGAGKYLTENSFFEINMRGTWGQGFSMRGTYTQMFLPGKLRPFIQAGLAWSDDLDLRAGLGLMYIPAKSQNWRFFMSASYERGSRIFENQLREFGVFEIGAQMRLRGTEPVLSDNNWMNSIPHYILPDGWYVEGSSNFAFFDKTKVTRVTAYAGKNISKRLFARGGIRLGRDRVILPAHLQYHILVRQKLRFGFYGGPSLNVSRLRLGAELGAIAYYEVLPNWSLFVAPVLLDNSKYEDRIFETGIRFYIPRK